MFLRTFENAVAKESLPKVLSYGVEITKEIVAEILANMSDLLQEISLHDEHHRVNLLKGAVSRDFLPFFYLMNRSHRGP